MALVVGCGDELTPTSSLNGDLAAESEFGKADCAIDKNDTIKKLLACVTLDGVRAHQAAFQVIADANNGTRASGTPGYTASAHYVANAMSAAGYQVTLHDFSYDTFLILSPSILQKISPVSGPVAHSVVSHSGSGDVTASVSSLGTDDGCEASDFAGFPAGQIALILRGNCTFNVKATNARDAGAGGVIIRNNNESLLGWTLGTAVNLPVVGVSQSDGQDLDVLALSGLTMRIKTETFAGTVTVPNVIAESVDGDPDNVIVVGAHLDSVTDGPGIQDNGSGSAAVLETGLMMAGVKPKNKIRFVWWGAEEAGLVGSREYLASLAQSELDAIALYLNFDMIASPNYVYGVYDGDNSEGGLTVHPAGSELVEDVFQAYYDGRALPHKAVDNVRSDNQSFIDHGIPTGGLFTGAEVIKTAEEAAIWGGTAGDQYDPCYHLACDTFANVSLEALEVNADAVAYATLSFAMAKKIEKAVRVKNPNAVFPTNTLLVQ